MQCQLGEGPMIEARWVDNMNASSGPFRRTEQLTRAAFIAFFLLTTAIARADESVLVEAESLDDCGGWVVDQQFMDLMGSPYLLATVWVSRFAMRWGTSIFQQPANMVFTVPARRDWVAPWKERGAGPI